jgi:hypothetical protein
MQMTHYQDEVVKSIQAKPVNFAGKEELKNALYASAENAFRAMQDESSVRFVLYIRGGSGLEDVTSQPEGW